MLEVASNSRNVLQVRIKMIGNPPVARRRVMPPGYRQIGSLDQNEHSADLIPRDPLEVLDEVNILELAMLGRRTSPQPPLAGHITPVILH